MKTYKQNAVSIGILFIFTMLCGMIDAYFVIPDLMKPSADNLPAAGQLLLGVFSVLIMAIGIVFIALSFYPVIKIQNETIALTYVIFRTMEGLLLILGSVCYLYILYLKGEYMNETDVSKYLSEIALAVKIKYYGYQLAMLVLGLGSLFLCYALYTSRLIPGFLSIWGGIGYFLLILSAVFDICGLVDTTKGIGAIMYVPGGLWELIVFPIWLFIKGFNKSTIESSL